MRTQSLLFFGVNMKTNILLIFIGLYIRKHLNFATYESFVIPTFSTFPPAPSLTLTLYPLQIERERERKIKAIIDHLNLKFYSHKMSKHFEHLSNQITMCDHILRIYKEKDDVGTCRKSSISLCFLNILLFVSIPTVFLLILLLFLLFSLIFFKSLFLKN
jgi:hypothetical protein